MLTTPLYKFTDEAHAKADPVIGPYWLPDGQGGGNWRGDVCIPNVQVWDPSQDATSTDQTTGTVTTTHTYQSGFFIRIAGPVLSSSGAYALPDGWQAQPDFAGA